MKRLHIVGKGRPGRTCLIEALIPRLQAAGLTVGSLKHTPHAHELDKPGKDSHRYREAGAMPAGIITDGLFAIYGQWGTNEDPYEQVAPMFAACDLVLIEGGGSAAAPKVEVWSLGEALLAATDPGVIALVSNDRAQVSCPVFSWSAEDIQALTDQILAI
jgi:molybdopterin-guanine dinucleotide biosynthesis adapter protein